MENYFLTIPEEIYLLSIDEQGIQYPIFRNSGFDTIISASILMDLAIYHKIDSDQMFIIPDKMGKVGDVILDWANDEIDEYNHNRKIEEWIAHFSMHGQYFRDEIITSLVRKGVLSIQNDKLLWIFNNRKYPMVNNVEVEEVQARIKKLVFGNDIPNERDMVIVSLLTNSNLLEAVFSTEEIEKYKERIFQISQMDFIGQAIGRILGTFKSTELAKYYKQDTHENMLQEHVQELKKKFNVMNDANLPAWIRQGTEQYQKTLEFVREKGTAQITFNPKTKEYSLLNLNYYSAPFGVN